MSAIPDELRDGKIGRFPVWAIGVILAGAIIVFMIIRNRNKATGEDTEQPIGTAPLETVDGIPTGSFADTLSGNFPQNVSLAPLPERPQTNAQWLMKAYDYLVGLGKEPLMVQRALQDYLAGKSLSDAQYQLIGLATSNTALSLPPEGVILPPVPTTTTPTPDPGGGSGGGTTTPTHVSPKMNYDLYTWSYELAALYPSLGLDFVKLFGNFNGDPTALNPGARKYMSWSDGPGYKIPKFTKTPPAIRIR